MSEVTGKEVIEEVQQRDYEEEGRELEVADGTVKLLDNELVIETEKLGTVVVTKPTYKAQAAVERFKAAERFRILREDPDVPTKNQLFKVLKEHGHWTDEEELEMLDLENQISKKEQELFDLTSPAKRKANKNKSELLAKQIAEKKNRYNFLRGKFDEFVSNTLEGNVENLSRFYLFYKCLKTEDGKAVWSTFDEMMENINDNLIIDIFTKATLFWMNLRDDFLDGKPEVANGESNG